MTLFSAMRVAALIVLAAGPAVATPAAEAVARTFCEAVRAADEAAAEALMTPDLQAAIARLRAADLAYRATYPGDKPPLGDGLRLTAFPDGLESCTPEAVTAEGADLILAPAGAPDAPWRDRLVLAPAPDGGVLVADILFAPDRATRFSDWLADSASWK